MKIERLAVTAELVLPRTLQRVLALLAFPILASAASAQNPASSPTVTVNGRQSVVAVMQVNGRSYLDVDDLARALGGSVSYAGSQLSLTIPTGGSNAATTATAAPPTQPASNSGASNPGFSKAFLGAAIEEAATLREWHAALGSAIRNGYPITADTFTSYRSQSETNLRLVSVAATTDSDRSAYQLLSIEFQNMAALSDRYVKRRANMTFISPDSLDNDGLNQRIVACGHSLSAMAASGQFYDDGSCHQ
jgi:hypothetical protein